MPRPTPRILPLLERSRLLSAAQWGALRREGLLDGLLDRADNEPQARELVGRLVERGWLTAWQQEMLEQGQSGFLLGQYQLLDCIGQGANGHVFRARHATLGRIAALKVLAPSIVRNRQAVARFHQEIQAAAALDHPNIVRAYDAETTGELQFLVMEYVDGRNLGDVAEAYGPLPVGWTCECLRQAALALQHAHERGMVHRDIKPSNLLVLKDPETGRPVVKLLDLGLARFVSEVLPDSGLTQSGQVLGTPDYISPEQAADTRKADIRSDIFSLGCTLFRLLTGTAPFGGGNVMEKLMARASHDAPPIRSRRPDVPAALEAVVARMLDRNPLRRFQTPGEAAEALAQFARLPSPDPLEGLPPRRRRIVPDREDGEGLERFLEKISEQMEDDATVDVRKPKPDADPAPTVATTAPRRQPRRLVPVLLAGAAVLSAASLWFVPRLWSTPGTSMLAIHWPPPERKDGRLFVDGLPIPFEGGNPLVISRTPGPHRVRAERKGFRPIEVSLDLARDERRPWTPEWVPTEDSVRQAALAALRSRSKGLTPGRMDEFREQCQKFVQTYRGTPEAPLAVQLLAALPCPLDRLNREDIPRPEIDGAGAADPAPPELVGVLGDSRLRHWNEVSRVAVHPRGGLIASASLDGTVRAWDASSGNLLQKWFIGDGECQVAFAPNAPVVATALPGREVLLWNFETGQLQATLTGSRPPFAFSPGGEWIVADAGDRGLGQWNVSSGTFQGTLPRPAGKLVQLQFAPEGEGELLAVETAEANISLVDVRQASPRWELKNVRRPVFDPAGKVLAAERTDEAARNDVGLWDLAEGEPLRTLDEAGQPVAFADEGQTLISARTGRVILWNADAGTEIRTFRDVPELLTVTPNRRFLTAADREFGPIQFWDLDTGESSRIEGHFAGIADVAFTPDSQLAVTASRDHSLKMWVVAKGQERPVAGRGAGPLDVSPDGRTLLLAGDDGSLKLWDVATRKASRTLVGDAKSVRRVAFGPNGRLVACVGDWGFFQFTLRLFEAGSGAEVSLTGDPLGTVRAFEFHPGGKLLAIASAGRDVMLFDLERRELAGIFDDDAADVRALAFSPDGRWLAMAVADRAVSLWDVTTKTRVAELSGLGTSASCLSFSPDGQWLAAGAEQGRAAVWSVPGGKLAEVLAVPGRGAAAIRYSPEGRLLAAAGSSGQLHLWDVSPEREPDPRTAQGTARPPTRSLTLGPAGGIISDLAFSPEGRHLLTVNGNGTVYVLRLETP